MDSLSYYLHNYWQENGDAKVSNDFTLMYGGPWKVLAIVVAYAFAVLRLGPRFMRDRKPYDLRPFMLVFNGFLFGINGAGFLVALWVTQLGSNSWSCSMDNSRWHGLSGLTMKYLGNIYLWMRLCEFLSTGFNVLRKKNDKNMFGQVLHNGVLVLYAYWGLKFFPRGMYCFLPLMDSITQSVRLAYLVLASAGNGLHFSLWWKKHVTQMQMATQAILLVNCVYLAFMPNCAGPMSLKAIVFVYSLGSLSQYVPLYRRMYLSAEATKKIE